MKVFFKATPTTTKKKAQQKNPAFMPAKEYNSLLTGNNHTHFAISAC